MYQLCLYVYKKLCILSMITYNIYVKKLQYLCHKGV